jgi:hypothetical protein
MSLGRRHTIAIAMKCCSLAAVFFLTIPSVLAVNAPSVIAPTSGGGQIAHVGEAFPFPISARVTDADGLPVAGAVVYFEVDLCVSFDPSACPPTSAFPSFPENNLLVTTTSDANGVATAPVLVAGGTVGFYRVFATLSTTQVFAHAYYIVEQTDTSTAMPIGAGFTGTWYDPSQSGHGVMLEVLSDDRLLAYWFTFTPDGTQQAWFGGVGSIAANQAVIYAERGQGGAWIPNFDPAAYSHPLWGTLTFTFTDCDHGRVDFAGDGIDSIWGENFMNLTRLTRPAGVNCP